MKNMTTLIVAACAACTACASPRIQDNSVAMTQNGATRTVSITYTLLDEPAVVTVDIQTNGVSIGGENLWYFAGDVNKVVAVGPHTVTWRPDKAWPGNKIDSGVRAVVTAWATNTPPNYMVASLVAAQSVNYYANAESVPFGEPAERLEPLHHPLVDAGMPGRRPRSALFRQEHARLTRALFAAAGAVNLDYGLELCPVGKDAKEREAG